MSLPASQQRALNQIEKTLADDHPGLGALFYIFSKLNRHEAMPRTERVTVRRWWQRRVRPAVATVVGLAMATGALLALGLTLPRPPACPSAGTSAAAHPRSVPPGRQPACAPRQDRPNATSQSGLDAR